MKTMKIALLGDIALFGRYSLEENKSIYRYFSGISELLSKYDIVCGNLETPFVDGQKPHGDKSAYLKSKKSNVSLLKFLKVNVVNLANNHMFDYGDSALALTKKTLEENSIRFFGLNQDQIVFEDKWNKVAFAGYCCYSTNPVGVGKSKKKQINPLNVPDVLCRLQKNKNSNIYTILSVHCGQEHINYPSRDYIRLGRMFSKDYDYIFYGHHPHVAQGIELINKSIIAYSLGNFCFDDVYTSNSKTPLIKQSKNNKESFILSIELNNNNIIKHEIIPIYLGKASLEVGDSSISRSIDEYSNGLKTEEPEYTKRRNGILSDYYQCRKKMRDKKWYFRRLRPRYVKILINSKINRYLYKQNVSEHLEYGGHGNQEEHCK